ncbi:MAG: hypothetical protein KHY19_05795 [Coprobacillus cateniformis]|nr:hypothetical protein [Coprobacillus cateniformis]
MMTTYACAKVWKEVVRIYNETRETNPKTTMDRIIEWLGTDNTKEVFATIAAIKKHDGRISHINREYVNCIPVNPRCMEYNCNNPILYAGLDDIHMAHIDQLITELRKIDK